MDVAGKLTVTRTIEGVETILLRADLADIVATFIVTGAASGQNSDDLHRF